MIFFQPRHSFVRPSMSIHISRAKDLDVDSAQSLGLVAHQKNLNKFTLLGVLDRCLTPGGKRFLRATILQPSCNERVIKERQACVSEFVENGTLLTSVQVYGDLPIIHRDSTSSPSLPRLSLPVSHPKIIRRRSASGLGTQHAAERQCRERAEKLELRTLLENNTGSSCPSANGLENFEGKLSEEGPGGEPASSCD